MSKLNKSKLKNEKSCHYQSYLSDTEIENGLKHSFIKGSLRLNPRNYKEAYVTHKKWDSDILIFDRDINRALFDDIVAVDVKKKYHWKVLKEALDMINVGKECDNNNNIITIESLLKMSPDFFKKKLNWSISENELNNCDDFKEEGWWKYFQRTGKVVGIISELNCRRCVGSLSVTETMDKIKLLTYIKFSPSENRYPRLMISRENCPADFFENPIKYRDVKFIAEIGEWNEENQFPNGKLMKCLDGLSVLERETEKIFAEYGVSDEEFSETMLNSLHKTDHFDPGNKYRRDLREKCVISIDPKTARDLDDALHIERLSERSPDGSSGLWEVGVHIADVTYYVTPGSEIDVEAARRTTTVYMVQKAVPMLPRILCEDNCSLNPGTDKYTYSVIYKMTDDCEIVDTWFGRTVVRMACRLSYEDAQNVLNCPDKQLWGEADFNEIYGGFTPNDIALTVLHLNQLATKMRKQRFEKGALVINQPKLGFDFQGDSLHPMNYKLYKLGESNRLIEEWMLRANMSVAEHIHKHLPEIAFLRNHPAPTTQAINGLNKQLKQMGWESLSLEKGNLEEFQNLLNEFPENEEYYVIMMNICSKSMQLAQYFCNNDSSDSLMGCHHFALNVPLYTHFTSPIRRYPDMIVHRQLTKILMQQLADDKGDDNTEQLEWLRRTTIPEDCDGDILSKLADLCNKKRKDAKSADEASIDLFFSIYLKEHGPKKENAFVVGLLDKAFDVLVIGTGNHYRIYLNNLEINNSSFAAKKAKLTLYWKRDKHCRNSSHSEPVTILTLMSSIDVILSAVCESDNSAPKIKVILNNPGCAHCQKSETREQNNNHCHLPPQKEFTDDERLCNSFDCH